MPIDFKTAQKLLATESFTVASLGELVKQVSGSVEGALSNDTYLLFSGKLASAGKNIASNL